MVRIGIIGLGFMGRMHYTTYQKIENAQVVAICDADPRRAKGDLSGGWGNVPGAEVDQLPMDRMTGTCDWRELIANPQVDVVDVCLPTPQHVEVVTAALEAGKHVMAEKPLARTSAEARKIATAAKNARGFFMPAMCMRFWGEWELISQAVKDGRFGKVLSATFRRFGSMPSGWFRDGKMSGGALLDLHVHDVDFIYHLFGRPKQVYARGYVGPSGEIDHVLAQYDYGTPLLVSAEGSWTATAGYGFTMRCTLNFERATVDFDFGRDPTLLLSADGKSSPVTEFAKHDGYVGELSYFLTCVSKGERPTRVTADDAVAGIEIAEAEKKSIQSGASVAI